VTAIRLCSVHTVQYCLADHVAAARKLLVGHHVCMVATRIVAHHASVIVRHNGLGCTTC